ncbi:hypothetical protein [Paraburkholderia kirstenboschensis]|uniref:Uncharacterized protein n=1 Tax=Paraburkholderia kirstenboschensis TaxID=1245436 RepID=A0ABZ0EP85_9BURK|nr:hypothetical protein [Paraburkholderia kirstenboschensis]WOD18972.1 hypothetical protein RW095_40580 [Paraburkholderia kirstenboschensis]
MLVDLDELVAECPDPRSRKYIRESVQCYKAGAYRSAVVACWIAVAFDLVDKIREVAASGDSMAQETIAKFDRARREDDVRVALAFEKDLLTLARDKFEFISPIEYIDLQRLADDRNRCAHPSQVSDTEVFEASAELARLHIVNATRYVLSQPAAQGKLALDRLKTELDANFFPAKRSDMVVFLRAGPLAKPRESLLRNYLGILLKLLLKEHGASFDRRVRATDALFAVADLHPEPWKRLIRELLRSLIPTLQDDAGLAKAVNFFGAKRGAELWSYIEAPDRLRLTTFVENFPTEHLEDIDDLVKQETLPLYRAALSRLRRASADELFSPMWFDTPSPVIDRLLVHYQSVRSLAEANEFGRKLRYPLMDSGEPQKHLPQLLHAAGKNEQVRRSNQFPVLLKEFVQQNQVDPELVRQMLRDAGLEELIEQL